MPDFTRTETYDYQLPEDLIAQYPLPERTDSRLLVVNRTSQILSHHNFNEIKQFLRPGDVLVVTPVKCFPPACLAPSKMAPASNLLLNEFKP